MYRRIFRRRLLPIPLILLLGGACAAATTSDPSPSERSQSKAEGDTTVGTQAVYVVLGQTGPGSLLQSGELEAAIEQAIDVREIDGAMGMPILGCADGSTAGLHHAATVCEAVGPPPEVDVAWRTSPGDDIEILSPHMQLPGSRPQSGHGFREIVVPGGLGIVLGLLIAAALDGSDEGDSVATEDASYVNLGDADLPVLVLRDQAPAVEQALQAGDLDGQALVMAAKKLATAHPQPVFRIVEGDITIEIFLTESGTIRTVVTGGDGEFHEPFLTLFFDVIRELIGRSPRMAIYSLDQPGGRQRLFEPPGLGNDRFGLNDYQVIRDIIAAQTSSPSSQQVARFTATIWLGLQALGTEVMTKRELGVLVAFVDGLHGWLTSKGDASPLLNLVAAVRPVFRLAADLSASITNFRSSPVGAAKSADNDLARLVQDAREAIGNAISAADGEVTRVLASVVAYLKRIRPGP